MESEGKLICTFRLVFNVNQVAWSPDGRYLAFAGEGGIIGIWDILRSERLFAVIFPGDAKGVAWLSKGKYILADFSRPDFSHTDFFPFLILDAATRDIIFKGFSGGHYHPGQLIPITENRFLMRHALEVHFYGVPPEVLEVGSHDLRNRYLPAGVKKDAKSDTQRLLAFSKDSSQVAATVGKVVYVTPLKDGHIPYPGGITYNGHTKMITQIYWISDSNQIVSADRDGVVHIWDATTGKTIAIYHQFAEHKLVVSPNGKYIASAGKDKAIHIWEIVTGKSISVYRGHSQIFNEICCFAWSPDGTQIASGDKKGFIHVWRVS
ncbi:MAG TPA: hypothetical protein VNG51_15810 [Ktedonobacteraceae bacterium]|nr:hypothetical protein [Ktedonobacteraceae bacterium]